MIDKLSTPFYTLSGKKKYVYSINNILIHRIWLSFKCNMQLVLNKKFATEVFVVIFYNNYIKINY